MHSTVQCAHVRYQESVYVVCVVAGQAKANAARDLRGRMGAILGVSPADGRAFLAVALVR